MLSDFFGIFLLILFVMMVDVVAYIIYVSKTAAKAMLEDTVRYAQERGERARSHEQLATKPAASLLRAGTNPTTTQNELLRPASATGETQTRELLRVSGNGE